MSGFFGVLQQDESSSSSDDETSNRGPNTLGAPAAHIPAYEDLSTVRIDEIIVLEAVYGDDFLQIPGVWGRPRLRVRVRPPDVEPSKIGKGVRVRFRRSPPNI